MLNYYINIYYIFMLILIYKYPDIILLLLN